MQLFYWKGISTCGKRISGEDYAPNIESLQRMLTDKNITPLEIKKRYHFFCRKHVKKITGKHIAALTQQCAMILKTGIPLSQAIAIISHDCHPSSLRKLLVQIKEKLERGDSFNEAIAHFPEYFNSVYCNLVAAGEQSGTLAETLTQLAIQLDRIQTIKSNIQKALVYPLIVLTTTLLITAGLLVTVIPQFNTLFINAHLPLPLLTRAVICAANTLQRHWIVLVIVALAFVLLYRLFHTSSFYHSLLLKIPFVKKLIISMTTARWTNTLATSYTAGLPITEALIAANNTVAFTALRHALEPMLERVKSGHPLHESLQNIPFFPSKARQLIAIGENTGTLETMLPKITTLYQEQFDNLLAHFNKLLEPILMLLLATVVGGLVIAMYLPVFKIGAVL